MTDFKAVNLTGQYPATPEQIASGVYDPLPEEQALIVNLLRFDECPDRGMIVDRADELALLAYAIVHRVAREMPQVEKDYLHNGGYGSFNLNAVIGGGPSFLMSSLEQELVGYGVTPYYCFSGGEGNVHLFQMYAY